VLGWLKLDKYIEKLSVIFCTFVFSVILIAGITQVIGRYVLSSSPPWTEELMRFCCIWLILVGSSLTIRSDGHVAVDILISSIKGRAAKARIFILTRLLCVLFLIVIFIPSIQLIMKTTTSRAASLPIGYTWVYLAVPVGVIFMLCSYITTIPAYAKMYRRGDKQ
jgi:TRAP-type C4-dicarboxylate transport system permease small subunit